MPLEENESLALTLEPYRIGTQIKYKAKIKYWDKHKQEKEWVLKSRRPQGLWNGLVPIIYKLQSGTFPGYKVGHLPHSGPEPEFDLSRTKEEKLPEAPFELAPPPTVAWPYSRRTIDQHEVDAGEFSSDGILLSEGGQPPPEKPIRAPSYSGPYAEEKDETEDEINKKALEEHHHPGP